jgi:hypothetical protein
LRAHPDEIIVHTTDARAAITAPVDVMVIEFAALMNSTCAESYPTQKMREKESIDEMRREVKVMKVATKGAGNDLIKKKMTPTLLVGASKREKKNATTTIMTITKENEGEMIEIEEMNEIEEMIEIEETNEIEEMIEIEEKKETEEIIMMTKKVTTITTIIIILRALKIHNLLLADPTNESLRQLKEVQTINDLEMTSTIFRPTWCYYLVW